MIVLLPSSWVPTRCSISAVCQHLSPTMMPRRHHQKSPTKRQDHVYSTMDLLLGHGCLTIRIRFFESLSCLTTRSPSRFSDHTLFLPHSFATKESCPRLVSLFAVRLPNYLLRELSHVDWLPWLFFKLTPPWTFCCAWYLHRRGSCLQAALPCRSVVGREFASMDFLHADDHAERSCLRQAHWCILNRAEDCALRDTNCDGIGIILSCVHESTDTLRTLHHGLYSGLDPWSLASGSLDAGLLKNSTSGMKWWNVQQTKESQTTGTEDTRNRVSTFAESTLSIVSRTCKKSRMFAGLASSVSDRNSLAFPPLAPWVCRAGAWLTGSPWAEAGVQEVGAWRAAL